MALLHFLNSFDPRPGIFTVRVGLDAVACRIMVAPPSSTPTPPLSLRRFSFNLVASRVVASELPPLSLSSRLTPPLPERLARLADELLRGRDCRTIDDDLAVEAEDEDAAIVVAAGFVVVVVDAVAVAGVVISPPSATPLNGCFVVVGAAVFIEANDEADCEFEAATAVVVAEDDNLFAIRLRDDMTTESAFEASEPPPATEGEAVDEEEELDVWVVTQSRLFTPELDIFQCRHFVHGSPMQTHEKN